MKSILIRFEKIPLPNGDLVSVGDKLISSSFTEKDIWIVIEIDESKMLLK